MAKRQRGRTNRPKVRFEIHIVAEEARKYGLRVPEPVPLRERFLSPNQAARILNVTGEAVKQWIYRRRLPATKLSNGYWQVRARDLEAYIHARLSPVAKRILILCEEDRGAQTVTSAIKKLGHTPVLCHNSNDLLIKAADVHPALVIADLVSAGNGVWSLLTKLRRSSYGRGLGVLLIANRKPRDFKEDEALGLRLQGCLQWPFSVQDVEREVAAIFSRIM
jgi:excisionase family DNA binding protein